MNQHNSPGPIIGSVFERKPGFKQPTASRALNETTSTGFPTAQHRSKSAFARTREENLRKSLGSTRLQAPPVPISSKNQAKSPSTAPLTAPSEPVPEDALRDSISKENEARIADMTPEEIAEEKREILARFGTDIGSVLEKVKRNRMKRRSGTPYTGHRSGATSPPPPPLDEGPSNRALRQWMEVPITPEEPNYERARSPPPPALTSNPGSRPSSRSSRRLRFAELEPQDVYVYESHPPSPRKAVLALPPPTSNDGDAVSLGTWHGRMAPAPPPAPARESEDGAAPAMENSTSHEEPTPMPSNASDNAMEEGTPEYIRRRYFPDLPANDPSLAWMSLSDKPTDENPSTSVRFDLHGNPISPAISSELPTSLGLHHHAEGSHAGYTLDDIFLLSRSTVPAQRAIMFGILDGIAQLLSKLKQGEMVPYLDELKGQEEELRKRILAVGIEAINERGNVGLRAVELVWQCLVAWDQKIVPLGLEGVWLESADGQSIRSLSLEFVLPSFSDMFDRNPGAYPHEFLVQVLEIVQRLALENKGNAKKIVEETRLLSGIVRYFLLSPHTQSEGSHLPHPEAINLLTFLARTSRPTAKTLAQFSDDLLRFIAIMPDSSPFPVPLATTLLASSLDFYTTLGNYGLCTHVPSTAMEQISRLSQYATSTSSPLSSAWARLAEVWIMCAVDPHVTSPPHDITWSRISAWGWQTDLLTLLDRTEPPGKLDWLIYGHAWGALAAWLEGAKVNGVRGGEKERDELIPVIRSSFESPGYASKVVSAALDSLYGQLESGEPFTQRRMKDIAANADVLTNAIRLWLAFVPPHVEGAPDSPSFDLPFDRISALAALLLSSPIWNIATPSKSDNFTPEQRYFTVYLRHLSGLLSQYLSLSQRLPAMTKDLWLAQAFSVILRFLPGGEDAALGVIREVLRILPNMTSEGGALAILEPFMNDVVSSRTEDEDGDDEEELQGNLSQPRTRLGPLAITPLSIPSTTTTVLISPFAGQKSQRQFSGLPLHRDWTLSAMDHLLHSGDSVVLKHLPPTWDASEADVTRISLAFALNSRDILSRFKLGKYAIGRDEAVVGCMKVFMLEHGLEKDAMTSSEEVFRDKGVEVLMGRLLDPYRIGTLARPAPSDANDQDLEKLGSRFLGSGTPFYQFYTDFVGLYDAISFSHPLFASLLLPPLSMRYAIDYRKLFWCDYPQILRTITVYPNQVLSSNLSEYLYPVEKNPQVIGALLSALVRNGAKEFLYWVTVHHVAANIWIDLRDEELDGAFSEDRAAKLLKAVVDQGDHGIVGHVVQYWQPRLGDEVTMPPRCFNASHKVLANRKQWIEEAVGRAYANRLDGLFVAT